MKLLHSNVLIKVCNPVSATGIIIPATVQQKDKLGRVEDVAPNIRMVLKKGEYVLFPAHRLEEAFTINEERFLIVDCELLVRIPESK